MKASVAAVLAVVGLAACASDGGGEPAAYSDDPWDYYDDRWRADICDHHYDVDVDRGPGGRPGLGSRPPRAAQLPSGPARVGAGRSGGGFGGGRAGGGRR